MNRLLPALTVVVAGCSSIPNRPCLTNSGRPSIVVSWFGARVHEIRGSGSSCRTPAVVEGSYQPCIYNEFGRRCVSRLPFAEQVGQVMKVWVRINHATSRITGFIREDCGSYRAAVVTLEAPDGGTERVYFDLREFVAVRDMTEELDQTSVTETQSAGESD